MFSTDKETDCYDGRLGRQREISSRAGELFIFQAAIHHLSPQRVNRPEDRGGVCFLKSCPFSAPFGRPDEDKPPSTARSGRAASAEGTFTLAEEKRRIQHTYLGRDMIPPS